MLISVCHVHPSKRRMSQKARDLPPQFCLKVVTFEHKLKTQPEVVATSNYVLRNEETAYEEHVGDLL